MIARNGRMLVPVTRSVFQSRCNSVVSGPARVHVSSTEKILLGGTMIASILAYPVYVLVNVKNYRAGNK